MQVTLVQLQAFLTVLDQGSFGGGAGELRMSQPSVSAAIKTLEKGLGGPLLHRAPSVRPTALGDKLLPHARAAVSSAQALIAVAQSHFGQAGGSVRLAASTTACQGLVPALLRHWRECLPDVEVNVLEADDSEMVGWLEDGAVDAAILIDPDTVAEGARVVASDSFHAVVRHDHPYATAVSIGVQDLIDEPVIVSNSGCRRQVMQMCRAVDPTFMPVQEVRELGTLMSMVRGHIGVSIMPSLGRSMLTEELVMVPLDPPLRRTLVFTGPERRPWNPLVTSLTERLQFSEDGGAAIF